MAFEIELKAWVDNPAEVENRLSTLAKYCYACEKDDVYWAFPGGSGARLRLRRENKTDSAGKTDGEVLVTCKTREMRGGVEVNDEQELEISDAAVFEKILAQLGLTPLIRKEKRGSAWEFRSERPPPILAELFHVKRLGWFIELEILCPVRDEESFRENRTRLLEFFDRLDIPRGKIETRPYTEMLAAVADERQS